MRKQRAVDITNIPLPRRAQSKLIQSTGRSSKSGSTLLLHQKLLPPGPPRSTSGINGGSLRTSQFCVSSSSMGVRKLPSRFYLLGKGRYGKRPPSFTAEYAAPSIDSEDSGFGCDFHSSESQLSWSNDEAAKLVASTNSTNSIQQPIFSLTSRTLSSSNLSTSSHISNSSTSSGSSYTIPQFSTSSPAEKQFLTTLLHESLAQEDHAIDQFDGPYYSTASISPASTSSPLSASDSTFSTISSTPSLAPSPESSISPGKVLLIVPGTTATTGVNTSQPLDFAQVFGKLSSTTPTSTNILNSNIVNELLQTRTALVSIAEEQRQEQVGEQQLACDSRIIKIDQGTHTKTIELSPEIRADVDSRSNDAFHATYSLKSNPFGQNVATVLENGNDATATSVPSSVSLAYSKLNDILIESSREALELQERSRHSNERESLGQPEAVPTTTATSQVDPMVILSQAVNLQKELFEEPALDGIPISVKSTNINGFGFSKGLTTTTTTATAAKGLVVDSHLPSTTTLLTVLPEQNSNQGVLDSSQQPMKLMQLTDNVRMSPDNADRAVTTPSALTFSVHQVTTSPMSTTPTQMAITSPSTPTAVVSSPIPMKRSRFTFPHPAGKGSGLKLRNQNHNQNYMPARSVGKRLPPGTTPTLTSNLASYTRDGRVQLQIVSQPEEQHRARYQTEGSRGAIKDRKGNGFPTVKLVGYDKPATLQIFIGTDQGKVSPHMFYQACKVTGKSSTPCIEKKVEGTIIIEIEFEPSKEMVISCDCVGILKERNVDVEQRFPFHHASQSRKKSTKCRMIYRTTVVNSDGVEETLQVASLPILCTQPPGVPEICKQSLNECPAKGGLELFVIGKNFLKDTRVIFQQEDVDGRVLWEASSEPLKDYLQQNHLICVVPPYKEDKTVEAVECKVLVVSGGKHSEPHRFTYLPELPTVHLGVPQSLSSCVPSSQIAQQSQVQVPPPAIQTGLVQQLQGGQGLMPMDLQTVGVNAMITTRENGLVKSVIVSSPSDSCSTISINSPEGSMCSSNSQSQPSPPAASVVSPVATTVLNPLSNMSFTAASLIQPAVTNAENATVVGSFQSALQQSVHQQAQVQQQQVETKPVVELMKTATEIMESINKSPVTSTFPPLALQQPEKPAVSNAIPLDLQFPTSDMPTTEAATVTTVTVTNPFQSNEQQLNCVSIPQMMNGMGMTTTIPTTATSPPVLAATVPVSDAQQQQQSTPTSPNNVVMANGSPPAPAAVSVQPLTVADCLGQAIIKAEPMPINNEMRLTVNNGVVSVAPARTGPQLQQNGTGTTPQVMGLLGGELQPHQGTLANALSQMSDNELINYINPNCFEGPLL